MKAFIYKTNQYLLERFPTLWNTRLVWMLLIAFVLHLIFFVFGFFTLTNPELLHEYSVKDIYFQNGTVFLNSIISILLLVLWLIYMFKNNAFKNYYPTTTSKLFGQFLCYLIIIFSCSAFFLSYNYGLKLYIATEYPDAQTNKNIEVTNDVAMFLTHDISDYTIDKRRYPKPFYTLYCEQYRTWKEDSLPKLEFLDQRYKFYTLKTKTLPKSERHREQDSSYLGFVFIRVTDSLRIYYYKDTIVDPSPFAKSAVPSLYNASFTFFKSRHDKLDDDRGNYEYNQYSYLNVDYSYNSYRPDFTLRHQLRSERNNALLDRNDTSEIKGLLENFITLSNRYKIEHNLTSEQWFNLIYQPDDFKVKHFIRPEPKDDYDYFDIENSELTAIEKFQYERLTDFYFNKDELQNVFYNIEDIKASSPLFDSIHFFMWFSFVISCIIFMFRVTGLKALLFSIITVGILTLFISLLTALIFYLIQGRNDEIGIYLILYFTLILGTIILAIPTLFIKKIKKLVVAICVNISIIGFPLYLFLIIGIITMHQNDICHADPNFYSRNYECHTLMDLFGVYWSYILFIIGILFLFFYSKVIKNWKSLPEG
ncbi:hypothetical protein [Psychroserpens algicola]|uniref:hypothetical protein n=1 Tax=Psychroserpens algicola TaxID=1719034 RepID=UPI001953190F|nr:hypothetical protein [Psychroserpens algicola]